MIPELLNAQHRAPRRKFRGKARYFRRVNRNARNFSLTLGPDFWWDFWHYHADWPGWGNRRWTYRLVHIEALATVFRTIASAKDDFSVPFQCWIQILGRDAGEDNICIHSPNANGTKFPYMPEGVDWDDDRLMPLFRALLPEYTLRIGHSRRFDEYAEPPRTTSSFYIYSPEIGMPLEK